MHDTVPRDAIKPDQDHRQRSWKDSYGGAYRGNLDSENHHQQTNWALPKKAEARDLPDINSNTRIIMKTLVNRNTSPVIGSSTSLSFLFCSLWVSAVYLLRTKRKIYNGGFHRSEPRSPSFINT
jgi:hypothetical protein